jgi:hypothetical protein
MGGIGGVMKFEGFLLSRFLHPIDVAFRSSFDKLSSDSTTYNRSPFQSRFRQFSAFHWEAERFHHVPEATEKFNHAKSFHTGSGRKIGELDAELVRSGVLQKVLETVAAALPIPVERYWIGVNQVRVIADDDNLGSPAPSLHQDGYDFSCHVAVERRNVSGGASIIATNNHYEEKWNSVESNCREPHSPDPRRPLIRNRDQKR